MSATLSVLLPVHNAEHRLAAGVTRLLDVLPDLTRRFDVLIIDDGSTDETPEVAYDLARRFPQVGVVRHPVRLGLGEAIQTGLDNTSGDVVLVGDEQRGIEPDDLKALWDLRDDVRLAGEQAARAPWGAPGTRLRLDRAPRDSHDRRPRPNFVVSRTRRDR